MGKLLKKIIIQSLKSDLTLVSINLFYNPYTCYIHQKIILFLSIVTTFFVITSFTSKLYSTYILKINRKYT